MKKEIHDRHILIMSEYICAMKGQAFINKISELLHKYENVAEYEHRMFYIYKLCLLGLPDEDIIKSVENGIEDLALYAASIRLNSLLAGR